MDNQLAHEIFTFRNPAVFNWRQLCALNTSKGTVRPVGHARVTGCETFTAIVKEFCFVKGWKASAIIACDHKPCPKNGKLLLAIAFVPDHLASCEAGRLS